MMCENDIPAIQDAQSPRLKAQTEIKIVEGYGETLVKTAHHVEGVPPKRHTGAGDRPTTGWIDDHWIACGFLRRESLPEMRRHTPNSECHAPMLESSVSVKQAAAHHSDLRAKS
jgi:hypothetical protein